MALAGRHMVGSSRRCVEGCPCGKSNDRHACPDDGVRRNSAFHRKEAVRPRSDHWPVPLPGLSFFTAEAQGCAEHGRSESAACPGRPRSMTEGQPAPFGSPVSIDRVGSACVLSTTCVTSRAARLGRCRRDSSAQNGTAEGARATRSRWFSARCATHEVGSTAVEIVVRVRLAQRRGSLACPMGSECPSPAGRDGSFRWLPVIRTGQVVSGRQ